LKIFSYCTVHLFDYISLRLLIYSVLTRGGLDVTTASIMETAHVLLSRQCTVDKWQFSGEVNGSSMSILCCVSLFSLFSYM